MAAGRSCQRTAGNLPEKITGAFAPGISGHNQGMKLEVDCYSGRKADERPLRFRLDGRQYVVDAVLDQWYDPEAVFFKVRADDGNCYILRQRTCTPDGEWELISFRQGRE